MNKLIQLSILFFLMNGSLLCQKEVRYYFEEYNWSLTPEDLIIGKKYNINDSCYFLFKFYDDRRTMINKTKYCNDKLGKISTYFVPKKAKKIKYVTYSPDPPYQEVIKTKRVYRFMETFPSP